ncbi:MAG TPA: HD domain-containing phosphohydrolase [Burkholderiales bacterium]|nr:HD domain-containing phosphohydrolase [Burkholderiales bacterium]
MKNETESELTIPEPESNLIHPIDTVINLKNLLSQQLRNRGSGNEESFQNSIYNIADLLQALCAKDKDAIVGSILLVPPVPYSVKHMLDTASVVAIILRAMEVEPLTKRSIIAAALTMNTAMMNLQDSVQEKLGSLLREQQQIIFNHPKMGSHLLEQSGVTDSTWLQTILQHHECLNGTGYPYGLDQDQICLGAKIVSVADSYCSRVCPRGDRGNRNPTEVMREIYQDRGKIFDETCVDHLIKQIGLFPPGTCVELNSGEDAIIVRQSNDLYRPLARRISKGKPDNNNIEVDIKSARMRPAFQVNFSFDPRALW